MAEEGRAQGLTMHLDDMDSAGEYHRTVPVVDGDGGRGGRGIGLFGAGDSGPGGGGGGVSGDGGGDGRKKAGAIARELEKKCKIWIGPLVATAEDIGLKRFVHFISKWIGFFLRFSIIRIFV